MSNRIFVGGLSFDTNDAALRAAFESYGEITDHKVMTDRDTGRSRGFGFVTFADQGSARKAIAGMNGTQLDGRTLKVDAAQERQGGRGARG
jgi:RNA recognition motif-containing protein